MPPLDLEERPLAFKTASVAHEGTVLANNPVTGDNDREWILPDCLADIAGQRAVSVAPGQRAIGRGLAERDLPEERPDLLLEGIAAGGDGYVKRRSLPGKVVSQLPGHLRKQRIGLGWDALPIAAGVGPGPVAGKVVAGKGVAGGDKCQVTNRRQDDSMSGVGVHRIEPPSR